MTTPPADADRGSTDFVPFRRCENTNDCHERQRIQYERGQESMRAALEAAQREIAWLKRTQWLVAEQQRVRGEDRDILRDLAQSRATEAELRAAFNVLSPICGLCDTTLSAKDVIDAEEPQEDGSWEH